MEGRPLGEANVLPMSVGGGRDGQSEACDCQRKPQLTRTVQYGQPVCNSESERPCRLRLARGTDMKSVKTIGTTFQS